MDLATAQQHLDAWMECELALSVSQRYTLQTPSGSQEVERVDLPEVRKQIAYWEKRIKSLSGKKRSKFSTASFNNGI